MVFREKEERIKMEGEGEKLPREEGGKKSMTKIIAAVVVIIVVVAAIGGALLLLGGQEPENKTPTVSFSASGTAVEFGTSIVFNATASSDPDGEIVNYTWQYGDGVEETKTSALTEHTYAYPGMYLIVLTVEDDKGATTTNWNAPIRVEVFNPTPEEENNDTIPTALAAASGGAIQNNTAVSFDANSSSACTMLYDEDAEEWYASWGPENIDEVEWNFADGSAVVSGNLTVAGGVSHTFLGDGDVYDNYVLVTSIHGPSQRYYWTIVVVPVGGTSGTVVKNPNIFTYAEFGEPQSLDPAWDYESAGGEVLQNVYETLVTYDHESTAADEMVPVLAERVPSIANGLVTPDFMNWTYEIREGVLFHYTSGTLTGADVEYCIERALIMNDPAGPAWMLGQFMIPGYAQGAELDIGAIDDAVELVDEMTVTIHLIAPMPVWNQIMAYTVASIYPMEVVEDNGGVQFGERNEYMNRNCDGTGPFMLVEWASNQHIIMKRFDNYWQEDKAKLQYVIVKKANDYGTRLMLLKAGDVDAAVMPVQHRGDMEGNADIVLTYKPTLSVLFMYMTADIEPGGPDIGDIPLTFFNDVNVRKAFCYAFNYEQFIEDITMGTAFRANGPIVQGLLGYDPDIPMYDYNLTKAAEYLNTAKDTRTSDPDDTYADNGFVLNLYYNAGNLGRQSAGLMIQDAFTEMSANATLGISGTFTVNVNALDWPTFLNARESRQLPCSIIAWGADYPDPDNFANPLLHQNGSFPYYSGMYNQTLSTMIEEAAFETDPALRIPMYHDISMSSYENAYLLYLDQPTAFFSMRSWVKGWYYNPMHSLVLYYEMYKA